MIHVSIVENRRAQINDKVDSAVEMLDGDIRREIAEGESEMHALNLLLWKGLRRVDQILDEVTRVEDQARGFVIGDVEEIEALTGGGAFGVVENGDVEAF